ICSRPIVKSETDIESTRNALSTTTGSIFFVISSTYSFPHEKKSMHRNTEITVKNEDFRMNYLRSILHKRLRHKFQHQRQFLPPVGPGMSAVLHAVFMSYLILMEEYMQISVSFVKEIVVAAADIPAYIFDLFQVVSAGIFDETFNVMPVEIVVQLLVAYA